LIPNAYIRQIIFILCITGLGLVIFLQLKNFLPAFLGAYTFYVLLRKWMFQLTVKLRGRKSIAALLLMLGSFIAILLPINGLIGILTSKILPALKNYNEIIPKVQSMVKGLEQKYGFDVLTEENLKHFGEWSVNEIPKLLGATFSGVFTVVVMYFILFFMLTEGQKLESNLLKWIPLKDHNASYLKKHLNTLVYSNAIGIPLVALLQGVVALIGYWITGVQEPFLWFIATCIAAMIPVVGAMIVYVPLSVMLFANGMTWQGVVLFLYGFLVIGSVDNVFRFWLQKRIGDTHPLVTVFGVIIGLNLFGFIGLVFGPILLSLFLLLIEIYAKEFTERT
jgi:predicted PurR-regulated permease PerM